jgi:hypothetical protein
MTAQHDPELCGPVRLAAPRVPVVRLSCRILYVIGGGLVLVVPGGLVALRAQGSRLSELGRVARSGAGRRAVVRQGVPIASRSPGRGSTTPLPAPALPPASPPPAKTLVEAELEGPAARARAARRRGGAVRCDGVRGSVWDGTRKRR